MFVVDLGSYNRFLKNKNYLVYSSSVGREEGWFWICYHKDIEHLYHAFMYSPVLLLSGIYPVLEMYSLLFTSDIINLF